MSTISTPLRRISAAALIAAAGILLAGCNQLTLEEVQTAPHRIVETGHDFWEGESWSYIGPSGQEVPLSVSCREGVFEGNCWSSEDGLIEFRYSKGKSGISSERMIFDGVEWPVECHNAEFWEGVYNCAALS